MTTAQVVETSVTVNNNSPIQDYVHPDDQTQPFEGCSWLLQTLKATQKVPSTIGTGLATPSFYIAVYEATSTFTGIDIKKKARNVGVIMDNNLSFSVHINEVCKNATPAIRSIGCTGKYRSYDGLKIFTFD